MLQYNPTVSGSLNITGSLQVSGDITGTVNGINITGLSQSVSSQLVTVQSSTGSSDAKFETLSGVTSSALTRLTNIESKSASVDISISNINSITSSFSPRVSNLESKSSSVDISISNINSITASNIARLSNLETKSSSVDISISNINSFTSSNDTKFTTLGTYTGSLDTKNTTLAAVTSSLISKTGSYATTGSNQFYGTQVFSGSVFIANDLVVQGSSSIQYISASSVSIGTNIVQLNTANPSVRYAGLTIIDSGSIGGSGSFLYDSVHDEFVFVHRGNGTNVTSSHFVLGPETFDNLGNETYLTCNILTKGTGKEHLVDSCIFDNGTTTCIKNNLVGTGTISGTTIYGSTVVCSPVGLFSGCVGIGKTPVFPLDVGGFAGDTIIAKFARGISECNFYISATNNEYVNLATEGSLRFKVGVTTNCPYSSGTSAMIITSAGNVLLNNTFGGAQMVIADSAKLGNGTPFTLSSTDASCQMQLVFGRVSNSYFSIQSVEQNIGYKNIVLQANGGNVGIATTTPSQPLQLGDVSVISHDANSMYVGANFGKATDGCYIKSQYANQIHFDSATGNINFKVAGSGTVGCTISYTTTMSLTKCGHFLLNQPANSQADYGRMTISTSTPKTTDPSTQEKTVLHLSTCETDTPFGLKFQLVGDACSTSRYVAIQTGDHYISNQGNIAFQISGGKVGIGTATPSRLLEVNGDTTLQGNNYINSTKMIQWEGGAYWTTRTSNSANQFEIYRGDTGATPFIITAANCIKLNGSFQNTATVGLDTFTIDTMPGYQSIANGGYVDFGGMSGILFVNNWSNGGVTIWLMGGGGTSALGSVVATVGAMYHAPNVGGYRWCNNYGSTANFGFQVFRTRNTA